MQPLCNSRAGGLITWTRVDGGSSNEALAVGSIRTVHDKPDPFQDMTADGVFRQLREQR
jgi:hypothetical protein